MSASPDHASAPAPVPVSEWPLLGRYNYLSDWPESQSSQFHMRPGKGDADNRHGKHDSRHDVSKREPPARQHQPDQIADQAERPGADIALPGEAVAAYRPLAEIGRAHV